MCMRPVNLNTDEKPFPFPCGKCPDCLKRRASGWSFRLMQQEKVSSIAQFITLTYASTTIPISGRGFMDLCKKDVQDFFKRLRKAQAKLDCNRKIRYYAVGEYGSRTVRPHYHIILFDCDVELIQSAWGKGQVHYGTVTGASIGYTLKYMCKPGKVPAHRNDDRQKEFSLMSKGLGANYLSEKMRAWHLADPVERMYINIGDGKKASMPRYYKLKIFSDEQRENAGYAHSVKMREQLDAEISKNPNYFRDREEAVKAAFKKMYNDSKKRNKV